MRTKPDPGRAKDLPDVRDGLTHVERVVLRVLGELHRETGGRSVPTATIYGRVVEHVGIGPDELQAVLARLGGARRRRR